MSWETKLAEHKQVPKTKNRSRYNTGAFYCDKTNEEDRDLWKWIETQRARFRAPRAVFVKALIQAAKDEQTNPTQGEGQ